MEPVWQWGLDVIRGIQVVHGPVLDAIMKVITFLCDGLFLVLMIPVFYWCVDFKLGVRLLNILTLSVYSSAALKAFFRHPRPFNLDPTVKLQDEVNFGLPSTHSQNAVVIAGSIAVHFKKRWIWITAACLMLAVSFSRIYLGVHFPTDVFAGWILGLMSLVLFGLLTPLVEKLFSKLALGFQLLLVAVITGVFLLLYPSQDSVSMLALFLGGNCGALLIKRFAPFKPSARPANLLLSYLFGAAGILAVYFGLLLLFPKEGAPLYHILRFVRYTTVSFWITFLAPWLFLKWKLVEAVNDIENVSNNI